MLHRFLVENREKILALARRPAVDAPDGKPAGPVYERGLARFYDRLIAELAREAKGPPFLAARKISRAAPTRHDEELRRLGYTVSQVVHGYGVLYQVITALAHVTKTPICESELGLLDLSLDAIVAEAIARFAKRAGVEDSESSLSMGILVHELRNALAAALVAHAMVRKGVVDADGRTNALLERNLNRMRDILDRSFSEVRMRHDQAADRRPTPLIEVVEEVEATAVEDARARGLTLRLQVDPRLRIRTDRHYLVSALSNLLQNAIKYSKPGGAVRVRSRETNRTIALEVEDSCGGLPPCKIEELFKPFTRKTSDRTGLGLGLTISRRAVALNGGTLAARDLPGKGCVFSIVLPKEKSPRPPENARHVIEA